MKVYVCWRGQAAKWDSNDMDRINQVVFKHRAQAEEWVKETTRKEEEKLLEKSESPHRDFGYYYFYEAGYDELELL